MSIEYPRLVSVETTNRCNARCKFCPNNSLARDRRIMSDDLFKKIINDCKEFPLKAIEPFLQGEPFMDPHIFDRLAYINEQLPETALRLYSNGAALTKAKSDMLRELNVDKLYISLNSVNKEKYEDIVGLPFERTMENVRALCAHDPKGPVAKTITLRITLLDNTTEKEIADFKALCKELGVRSMMVGLFNYKGDIPSNLPVPNFPCEHIDRLDILSNGHTTLCCMDQEGEYGWGDVINHSVLEVFNSPAAKRVREMHRSGQRKALMPCSRCNLFWPSFKHMPALLTARHIVSYVKYIAKYQPLKLHKNIDQQQSQDNNK